ncbi:hypothetical protein DFW84_09000 [Campylobacter coli]|nr:hypothetical protein [Campylobacter coli]
MKFKDFLFNSVNSDALNENVQNYIAQKIPGLGGKQLKSLIQALRDRVDLQNADIKLLTAVEVNNLKKNTSSEFDYLFVYPDEKSSIYYDIGYVFIHGDLDYILGTKYQKKTLTAALKTCIADFNNQSGTSRVFCFAIDSESRRNMYDKQTHRRNSKSSELERMKDSGSSWVELDKSGYDKNDASKKFNDRLRVRLNKMGLSKYENVIRNQFEAALEDIFNSDVIDSRGIDELYTMVKLLKDAKEQLAYYNDGPKKFLEIMRKF